MSKKSHLPGPIPAGNRPQGGTSSQPLDPDQMEPGQDGASNGEPFQEQDPKRRLGDFTGKGEHSRQQPGPKNDGGERHSENG